MDYRSARTFAFFLIALTSCGDVRPRSRAENYDARKIASYINKFPFKYESPLSSTKYTERIAGGSYANEGQFPFMAVVHRLIDGRRVAQCGGTIISERWVLTAGHCVAKRPRRFFVIFGIVDKTGIGYDVNKGPGVAMITTSALVHPNHFFSRNDIGLLHMPRDIPFSDKIQPIHLAGPKEMKVMTNATAYVVGWGRDGYGFTGTKRLKYALMPLISKRKCTAYWRVDYRNICTIPGLGKNACQGDSGGPLFIMRNDQPLQIGIVSYGDAHCPSGKPGVYTRVAAFAEWIQDVTGVEL
ncbi:chymotrypsin-like protease CTRL-1 [Odontomachus brunneus]|uniref:chymotrypsin-like protease CTRL-1 n=1 Tax=Odontomachus brunneus TaxID=486640 RepID=UPI0013F1C430|nr:chymotrypsin-like protease CTRL-1 [Odontomachus brunneus]